MGGLDVIITGKGGVSFLKTTIIRLNTKIVLQLKLSKFQAFKARYLVCQDIYGAYAHIYYNLKFKTFKTLFVKTFMVCRLHSYCNY